MPAVLPEPSHDKVLKAFKRFDRHMRADATTSDWDDGESQQYVVKYGDRLYPPKRILSITSGIPISELGDGEEVNKVFTTLGFDIGPLTQHRAARARRQVWWVNQDATYDLSRAGGFLWAPKRDKRGEAWGKRRRLDELRPDDLVVHHADSRIRAIGRVQTTAVEAPTPFPNKRPKVDGWRVGVEYFELGDRGIPIERAIRLFKDLELDDGPFTNRRGVKPGYLWPFSSAALQRLEHEVGTLWPEWAHVDGPPQPTQPTQPAGDAPFRLAAAVEQLTDAIGKRGFVFEPWQVAAFVTAVRTKPFVILAGVSGTGKSRLPCLVAEATRCTATVIPVRPDWTDSSDVLGYVDLQGSFCPGPLLEAARRATHEADRFHFCVIDEMNLARVEHYLAEVLSRIEGRSPAADGTLQTAPLLSLARTDTDWATTALPSNLAIVGTVNMDESAHGFSRKVLDRAFTLEFSDIDLHQWADIAADPPIASWPLSAWRLAPPRLAQHATGDARGTLDHVVDVLVQVNAILTQAQLQVGYRTRDEIASFVLNAADIADRFVTRDRAKVAPLDLALVMKILPRIAGGSAPVRQVVIGLLGFATRGKPLDDDPQADDIASSWRAAGRPAALPGAPFPRTAARLCLMWERLATEGFTSFWL
jgi:dynein-related subfamily AAA family protein